MLLWPEQRIVCPKSTPVAVANGAPAFDDGFDDFPDDGDVDADDDRLSTRREMLTASSADVITGLGAS